MPDRIIDMAGPVGELCWLVCAYQNSTPGGQPLFLLFSGQDSGRFQARTLVTTHEISGALYHAQL